MYNKYQSKFYFIKNKICNEFKNQDFITAVKNIIFKGFLRPLFSRLSYVKFHNKYPQNIIFIAGFAKSGSTWIAKMFSSIPGFYRMAPKLWRPGNNDLYEKIFLEEFHNKMVVIKGHTWGTVKNVEILKKAKIKHLITIRDPRDKIISAYYYIKNHPDHPEYSRTINLSLSEYIDLKLNNNEFENEILNWLKMWYENRDPSLSLIVRYEDFLKNPIEQFKRCLLFLGFELEDTLIKHIVELHSFERQAGRKPGAEDKSSFLRKGVSGEWKEIFTVEQRRKFSQIADEFIVKLGYKPTISYKYEIKE